MTVGEAIKEGTGILKECCNLAWLDASIIMSYVIGKERWYLVAHQEEELTQILLDEYFSLIHKRLSGMPVQYITNCQEFMSLNFFVNEWVLIPRPETEILVEEVLRSVLIYPESSIINVADIGTGSGCISVSIARNTENTRIKAIDVSREALAVAEKNAVRLGVSDRIEFIQSDLFNSIKHQQFDIIVSNPPYIPSSVIDGLQVEVREHEPRLALDGGVDGLEYYRKIISQGFNYLKPGGLIVLEIGCDQGQAVRELAESFQDYDSSKIVRDLAQKDRVITISRKI